MSAMATALPLVASLISAGSSSNSAASPAARMRTSIVSAVAPGSQRVQELLVDVVEAAIGHHDHEIPIASLSRDSGDDIVSARDVARIHAGSDQILDDSFGREPLIIRKRRPEHSWKDDSVGTSERTREIRLEHPSAGGRGSR